MQLQVTNKCSVLTYVYYIIIRCRLDNFIGFEFTMKFSKFQFGFLQDKTELAKEHHWGLRVYCNLSIKMHCNLYLKSVCFRRCILNRFQKGRGSMFVNCGQILKIIFYCLHEHDRIILKFFLLNKIMYI